MPFKTIIADAELWDGDMTARRVDGHDLLIVRHNGVVYAYENRCAHLGVALSEGRLDRYVLTCRAHHWQYDVRSGSGVNPATACLRRFAVKIEDGKVFVDVHAPGPDFPNAEETGDGVGPVLTGHPRAQAVLEAIRRLNPSVEILNRGSYIRVLAPRREERAVRDLAADDSVLVLWATYPLIAEALRLVDAWQSARCRRASTEYRAGPAACRAP